MSDDLKVINDWQKFQEWRRHWCDQARFTSPTVPDVDERIKTIIRLWGEEVPGSWHREMDDLRCLRKGILCEPDQVYTRGDKTEKNKKPEHQIEWDVIQAKPRLCTSPAAKHFEIVVNAFPLVKNRDGGQEGKVEIDLLGLLTMEALGKPRYFPVVLEAKATANNPWYATVENLLQLKLFRSNAVNGRFLEAKLSHRQSEFPELEENAYAKSIGMVLAKPEYFASKGQKANSVNPTCLLLKEVRKNGARIWLANLEGSEIRSRDKDDPVSAFCDESPT